MLNVKKCRPHDISSIKIFSFFKIKNELLVFLGWPCYVLERLTILSAIFNFAGFIFSLIKGIYNICSIHTHTDQYSSKSSAQFFASFFGIFSTD